MKCHNYGPMVIVADYIVSPAYTGSFASVLADESTETNRLPACLQAAVESTSEPPPSKQGRNEAITVVCTMSSDKY